MVYTYLLRSLKNRSYYCGISKDPVERINIHNSGKVFYTKDFMPWELVFTKPHANYIEARKHEKWLKKKNRQYKDKLAGQVGQRGKYVIYKAI